MLMTILVFAVAESQQSFLRYIPIVRPPLYPFTFDARSRDNLYMGEFSSGTGRSLPWPARAEVVLPN